MNPENSQLPPYNPDKLTEAQLWAIGLSSMLSCQNYERVDTFFGCRETEELIEAWKESHEKYWGVSDHDGLLDMGKWIVDDGGHNAGFMARYHYLLVLTDAEQQLYIEQHKDDADEYARLQLIYNNIGMLGSAGIMAWDMGRYVNLLKKGVVIGFLTREEGWAEMFRVARLTQPHFNSWMEYYQSYAVGRQYWRLDISEENALHGFYCIERLKQDPYSPINKLAWQIELPGEL